MVLRPGNPETDPQAPLLHVLTPLSGLQLPPTSLCSPLLHLLLGVPYVSAVLAAMPVHLVATTVGQWLTIVVPLPLWVGRLHHLPLLVFHPLLLLLVAAPLLKHVQRGPVGYSSLWCRLLWLTTRSAWVVPLQLGVCWGAKARVCEEHRPYKPGGV